MRLCQKTKLRAKLNMIDIIIYKLKPQLRLVADDCGAVALPSVALWKRNKTPLYIKYMK